VKKESAMNAATFTSTFGHCKVKAISCTQYEIRI